MKNFNLTYKRFSEDSVLISWPEQISNAILVDIRSFSESIEQNKLDVIVDFNFVYNSLLVVYKSEMIKYEPFINILKTIYSTKKVNHFKVIQWEIPVCYDAIFGIDLESISQKTRLTKNDIIDLHKKALYTIYGIGFLPGFLYLGGLPEALHFPRLNTPRPIIEKGAVGIGGTQTGIYPKQSPGGWNIIGNTPISIFDSNKKPPCVFKPGDKIKFESISIEEYKKLKEDDLNHKFSLKNKSYD